MKYLSIFCILFLALPVAAMGQNTANKAQNREDIPAPILDILKTMGVSPKSHDAVYHALVKACNGKIHVLAEEPRNAYGQIQVRSAPRLKEVSKTCSGVRKPKRFRGRRLILSSIA
jgi:hypothetical protein